MSADNILGIYKVNNRKFVGRSCWSECEDDCSTCASRIIFTAKSISESVKKAQEELQNDVYEYGYIFKNL